MYKYVFCMVCMCVCAKKHCLCGCYMCVPMYVACQVVYEVCVLYGLRVVHVCMHYTCVQGKLICIFGDLETRTEKLYRLSVLYTIHFCTLFYPWMLRYHILNATGTLQEITHSPNIVRPVIYWLSVDQSDIQELHKHTAKKRRFR